MEIFWEIHQGRRIAEAAATAGEAKWVSRDNQNRLHDLQKRVDFLSLANQALWELLRDRFSLQDYDLMQKIDEIDLRDGKRDGKAATVMTSCPSCRRRTVANRSKCMYCGVTIDRESVF